MNCATKKCATCMQALCAGFAAVMEAMRDCGKPMVGHNLVSQETRHRIFACKHTWVLRYIISPVPPLLAAPLWRAQAFDLAYSLHSFAKACPEPAAASWTLLLSQPAVSACCSALACHLQARLRLMSQALQQPSAPCLSFSAYTRSCRRAGQSTRHSWDLGSRPASMIQSILQVRSHAGGTSRLQGSRAVQASQPSSRAQHVGLPTPAIDAPACPIRQPQAGCLPAVFEDTSLGSLHDGLLKGGLTEALEAWAAERAAAAGSDSDGAGSAPDLPRVEHAQGFERYQVGCTDYGLLCWHENTCFGGLMRVGAGPLPSYRQADCLVLPRPALRLHRAWTPRHTRMRLGSIAT